PRRVPKAIVISRLIAKRIPPRRYVCAVSSSSATGFGPVMIEAFKHVAVAHLLRRGKAQSRVIELEMHMPGTDSQLRISRMQSLVHVVHCKAHQRHRRRNGIHREMRRVDLNQSFGRSKPQQTVMRSPRRRMAVGRGFTTAQTVRRPELYPMGTSTLHVAVAARQTISGGKPQMHAFIIENGVNGRAIEPVLAHRREMLTVPQVPPMILRSNQEGS